jgi:hypothetical protein
MNTYRLLVQSHDVPYLVTRWSASALTKERLSQSLAGVAVRDLSEAGTGRYLLELQLQRPSHDQALSDILVALQQLGYSIVEAMVSEWVSAVVQGLLLGAASGGAVGSASRDPRITFVVAAFGAAAGAIAGSGVRNVKVVYQVQRTYPSGWVLTPVQEPDAISPTLRPGLSV